jgi:8-oxo-dGTP diphosphatase
MPIRVLASVIQHDGHLLVCQRPYDKRHGGLREVPGGKVKDGESDLEAVGRELREKIEGSRSPAGYNIGLNISASTKITRWAYQQVARQGGQGWVKGKTLVWLGEGWRGVLAG